MSYQVRCPSFKPFDNIISIDAITPEGAVYAWCLECQRQESIFYKEIDGLTVRAVGPDGVVHEIVVTTRAEPKFYFKEKENADPGNSVDRR